MLWWISYLMVVQYVYKRGSGGIVVLVHICTLYNAHIIMTFSNDVFQEISPCINSCHISICLYICICFCSPSLSLLLSVSLLQCVYACVFVFHDSIKLQNHNRIIYTHTHIHYFLKVSGRQFQLIIFVALGKLIVHYSQLKSENYTTLLQPTNINQKWTWEDPTEIDECRAVDILFIFSTCLGLCVVRIFQISSKLFVFFV